MACKLNNREHCSPAGDLPWRSGDTSNEQGGCIPKKMTINNTFKRPFQDKYSLVSTTSAASKIRFHSLCDRLVLDQSTANHLPVWVNTKGPFPEWNEQQCREQYSGHTSSCSVCVCVCVCVCGSMHSPSLKADKSSVCE